MKKIIMLLTVIALVFSLSACAGGNDKQGAEATPTPETQKEEAKLSGTIEIDGSSTVFPITEGIAEEFGKIHSDVRVPVGVSGTGGGFKRFCAGETDISDASRPIKDKEKDVCNQAGIEWIELPVAYDGLSVLVSPKNDWVDHMTVDELKKIFEPESKVKTWADVRAGWPNKEIKIYSPGSDSGTFDYFTEVINGKGGASRNDSQISFSEDDNVLVQGIAGDQYAIGYFGVAYYEENKDKLKLVAVDGGNGAVSPSKETINNGTYSPLSRPIFIYVKKASLEKPEVKEFAKFYLENAAKISLEVGYFDLPADKYTEGLAKIK